jgi:hypothetical protein
MVALLSICVVFLRRFANDLVCIKRSKEKGVDQTV